MHKSFEKIKWEDLYSYWRKATKDHLYIVNRNPSPYKRAVKTNSQNRIYTYHWVRNDKIDDAVNCINCMAELPVDRRNPLADERIMRAADLMVQSKATKKELLYGSGSFAVHRKTQNYPILMGCQRIGRNLNDTRGLLHSFRDCREQMAGLFHDLREMMGESCLDWEIAFEFRLKRARYVQSARDRQRREKDLRDRFGELSAALP